MAALMGLPGPRRFLARVLERRARGGVTGVRLPGGLADLDAAFTSALEEEVRHREGLRLEIINLAGGDARSPAHVIGARAGGRLRVRSIADLAGVDDLAGRTFLVRGADRTTWGLWSLFLQRLRKLNAGLDDFCPAVIFIVPLATPPREERETFGPDGVSVWQGVLGRSDVSLYALADGTSPGGIFDRLARETCIEVAGWNLPLLEFLLEQDDELQVDPRAALREGAYAAVGGRDVCWEEGLVDVWEGWPRVDTLALLAAEREEEVRKRVWRAHASTLFPVIDEIRSGVVRRHLERMKGFFQDGGWRRTPTEGFPPPVLRTDPFQLELGEVLKICADWLDHDERQLLRAANALRRRMAHMEPARADEVRILEDLWTRQSAAVPPVEAGWNWPRCGQVLTVMVGPSGAGKSTWVAVNCEAGTIVSSDAIREEGGRRDSEWVFAEVQRRASALLSSGRNAVIDATQLRAFERAASRSVAPSWVPVRYVVIDRPMEEKIRDGGWRLEAENGKLIEMHARMFAANLAEILDGDGVSKVEVLDLRAPGSEGLSAGS